MPRMKTSKLVILTILIASLIISTQAQDAVTDLLGRINGLRGSLGLPGYTLNGALSAAALNQAQYMANTGQISHTQADGSTPRSRASAAGYTGAWVSENIYAGTSAGVGDAWTFWLNSPIHYRGMTNPNYQEIGIASASSSWGRAFVLVFGSPGSAPYVAPSSGGGGSTSASSAPPSFVVGLDSHGNIMHEVQPEQTIGDILLTYGYTWDNLPEFLTLNHKTDADIRRLQIGEIVLVPPYGGTYTPTPYPDGWPTNTPEPEDFVATAIAEAAVEATAAAMKPSPTASPSRTPLPPPIDSPSPPPETQTSSEPARIATAAGVPAFLAGTSTSMSTATNAVSDASPTAIATVVANLNRNGTPQQVAVEDVVAVSPPGESPWLIFALIFQALVIIGAGIWFVRDMRKR